jgi:hypothetical protein
MPFEVIFQIILPFHQTGWPPLLYTFAQLSVGVSSFHVLCLSSLEGYDQLTDLALEYIVGGNDQSSETGSKISKFELLKEQR